MPFLDAFFGLAKPVVGHGYRLVTGAFLSSLVALLPVSGLAQRPVAELPRVYIDTTWRPPSGTSWAAHNSTELRTTLNAAQPGDTIILDAGVIYSGNFTLPAKNNPSQQWIYIETSALTSLPNPGTRVTPLQARLMPKIVTPNGSPAFTIAPGGGYVRLVGIEMYSTSSFEANPHHRPWPINGFAYFLLFGKSVGNVTVDRCYLHGSGTEDINHGAGFGADSGYIAVVDSDIRDIHGWTFDSQAFATWASPGPFKLANNYLSATTEEVMFGGAGGYSNPYVPSDIEIRHNHFYKPPAWEPETTGPAVQWTVKNNLECKSCLRMLVTGNTMENVWLGGDQAGENIILTPRTYQSGYNSVVDDITIKNNLLKNANWGFLIAGYDNSCPSCTKQGETKRVVIENNLILTRDPADKASYDPLGFLMAQRMNGILVQHNTVEGINGSQSWASIYFTKAVSQDYPIAVWVLDNALSRQPTGDGAYQGQQALDTYMPLPSPDSVRFAGNAMFVPPSDRVATWPLHNYATTVPFTFANPFIGDYELVTPDWRDTSDGKIAGVDMNALNAEIQ